MSRFIIFFLLLFSTSLWAGPNFWLLCGPQENNYINQTNFYQIYQNENLLLRLKVARPDLARKVDEELLKDIGKCPARSETNAMYEFIETHNKLCWSSCEKNARQISTNPAFLDTQTFKRECQNICEKDYKQQEFAFEGFKQGYKEAKEGCKLITQPTAPKPTSAK